MIPLGSMCRCSTAISRRHRARPSRRLCHIAIPIPPTTRGVRPTPSAALGPQCCPRFTFQAIAAPSVASSPTTVTARLTDRRRSTWFCVSAGYPNRACTVPAMIIPRLTRCATIPPRGRDAQHPLHRARPMCPGTRLAVRYRQPQAPRIAAAPLVEERWSVIGGRAPLTSSDESAPGCALPSTQRSALQPFPTQLPA